MSDVIRMHKTTRLSSLFDAAASNIFVLHGNTDFLGEIGGNSCPQVKMRHVGGMPGGFGPVISNFFETRENLRDDHRHHFKFQIFLI